MIWKKKAKTLVAPVEPKPIPGWNLCSFCGGSKNDFGNVASVMMSKEVDGELHRMFVCFECFEKTLIVALGPVKFPDGIDHDKKDKVE